MSNADLPDPSHNEEVSSRTSQDVLQEKQLLLEKLQEAQNKCESLERENKRVRSTVKWTVNTLIQKIVFGDQLYDSTKKLLGDLQLRSWQSIDLPDYGAVLLSRMLRISILPALLGSIISILNLYALFQQNGIADKQRLLMSNQTDAMDRQTKLAAFEQASKFRDLLKNTAAKKRPNFSASSQIAILSKEETVVTIRSLKALLRDNDSIVSSGAFITLHLLMNDSSIGKDVEKILREGGDLYCSKNEFKTKAKSIIGFEYTNLQDVNLEEFGLKEAVLNRAKMGKATLIKVNLDDSSLIEADLSSADLSEAELKRANLVRLNKKTGTNNICESGSEPKSYQSLPPKTIFLKANLSDADLSSSDLRGSNFSEANLSKANFHNADLRGSSFKNTFLGRIQAFDGVTEADLPDFSDARLEGADFTCAYYTYSVASDRGLERERSLTIKSKEELKKILNDHNKLGDFKDIEKIKIDYQPKKCNNDESFP